LPMDVQPMPLTTMYASWKIQTWRPFEDTHKPLLRSLAWSILKIHISRYWDLWAGVFERTQWVIHRETLGWGCKTDMA
jgi:hypothetical protein